MDNISTKHYILVLKEFSPEIFTSLGLVTIFANQAGNYVTFEIIEVLENR